MRECTSTAASALTPAATANEPASGRWRAWQRRRKDSMSSSVCSSHTYSRTGIALVLTLLAGIALLTPPNVHAEEPAPHPGTVRFEIDFLSDMIDHHEMAIQMGEMCIEKAIHEDLRDLCANVIAAQSEETEMMQAWLSSWYGITHEPQMKPGEMKDMERLMALSGAEFEIEFMEMMTRHHAKAVKTASRCVRPAHHQELQVLCSDIVSTQTAEIQLMRSWLCDWYHICRPARVS